MFVEDTFFWLEFEFATVYLSEAAFIQLTKETVANENVSI